MSTRPDERVPRIGETAETFHAAQRRHRRTARGYGAMAAVAALGQAVPAAIMTAPITLSVAVLVTDVVNLVRPTPDLLVTIDDALAARDLGAVPPWLLAVAIVPGMLAMVALWWFAQRFLLRDGLGGVVLSAGGRPPDPRDAEEHQLVNVVEELSLAAGIRTPRLLVLPADVPNAAAFGRDPDHATIAVSRGLLDDLDRDATQGVVAHLVASIGNGDLRMRHALLAVFLAYALAADVLVAAFSPRARRRLRPVWRMLRGAADPEQEAHTIRELLRWDDDENLAATLTAITWRFAQVWTNLFLVGGLLALPFRARKYLADATAVQLAATPDGIGRALVHLDRAARPLPGAEWAAIYTITSPAPTGSGKPGDDSLEDAVTLPGSLHPAPYRRVRRLRRLGFRGWLPAPPRFGRDERFAGWSWPMRRLVDLASLAVILFVILPLLLLLLLLLLLVAVAFGGLVVCVELGMLFYAALSLPVALPLHVLLRFLA